MRSRFRYFRFCLSISVCILVLAATGRAQETPKSPSSEATIIPAQITQVVDENNLVVLKGNVHPLARAEYDQGSVGDAQPLNRMLLLLQRSADQESVLRQLLDDQQSKSSPNYHAWLTPEQFGKQFGPADADIQAVTAWLASHGFTDIKVGPGRTVLEFSGTVASVRNAFHTQIHKFVVDGEEHMANASDPQIPASLTPVVSGIVSLHNFPRKPLYRNVGVFSQERDTGRYGPLSPFLPQGPLRSGGVCGLTGGTCHQLAPYDFATIYNVLPLWNASTPIDGTGQVVAIVGQSDIYPQDVSDFRRTFGLPAPNLNIIYNGTNPFKLATQGDEEESDLDVEWSGAIAKGATIDLVVSASTNSSAGVDLSAEYIVDNNVAPIMSESYGACELDLGTAGNQFYNNLWQQAAAEGISVFVATGDSGSAVCDRNSAVAANGLSVNGISSTPYNVAVGGTDFNDLQNPSAYWNSTNDPVTQASAKSYIPEAAWNDSCTNSEFFQFTGSVNAEGDCNDSSSQFWPLFLVPVGGSGGASNCTVSTNQSVSSCAAGYAKPSWQAGSGVPHDGKRDLPDVSLFAGDGLNASFYLVCETDIYGGCPAGLVPSFVGVGGTSASAPTLAGIMAMVNQKMQSRQGNVNYVFYPLAAQPGASCNSTSSVGSSCVFYDVTTGTIAMPCVTGSPNCVTNVAGDQNGVLSGYSTTVSYDLATGLGSVNVTNLANNWNKVSFQPTVSTLSLSPTTQISHGAPVNVNITVAPKTGTGTPTGLVSLLASTGKQAGSFTLANGSISTTTSILPGGSYTVTAHYAGDGVYGSSDSSPAVPVMVNPEPSTATLQAFTLDQNGNSAPFTTGPYGGSVVFLRATAAGQSGQGTPTGTVNFTETLNGTTTNLAGDPYSLNNAGYVMTPLPGYYYQFFTPGMYSFAANYSGDASFNPNSSPSVGFTITKAQTSTATSIVQCSSTNQPCTSLLGSLVTIFGTVQSNTSCTGICSGTAANLPTGTMTFYSNGTQLGPAVMVDSSIIPPVASFSTAQLPLGQNSVTVQYRGDTNYTGSLSAANLIDVVIQTQLGLTASSTTLHSGQNVTFTAQVGPIKSGGPPLTGTVIFTANGANLGNAVNLSNNGQAQITTNSLPIGSVQIVANYSGDANYLASSAALAETVTGTPDFTISTSGSTMLTVPAGQTATFTNAISVAAQNGFSAQVNLSCSLPIAATATTCAVTPNTLASGSGTATVTVTTMARGLVPPFWPRMRFIFRPQFLPVLLLTVLLSALLLWLARTRRQRFAGAIPLAGLVLFLMLQAIGCGGGSSTPPPPPPPTGTPAGTYTVTVTGTSGATSHTTTVMLTVN
jgi:hypothetical protein